MNYHSLKLLLSLALAFPLMALAQSGTIRGKVIDEIGEPLFSANAILKGTTNGTTTDFDGNFEIRAEPGTYTIEISFIGYASQQIEQVEVKAGEITVLGTIKIEPASNELAVVTITAEQARNTEAALITVKKKSANVVDGISADKLRKTGDSDAADAAKRVTGVSVEGGKYVYVRGLGDRYTKTMLNGVDVPGLDPDRNSIQIDIFPINLVENMTILKTALAELPADFTGGVVNIETKDFPVDKIFDVSIGVGYNPAMHFNSNYLTYEGGATDFLGFDDGTRAIPDRNGFAPRPLFDSDQEVGNFVREFNSTLGAMDQTSFMDFDLGLTFGDQKSLKNGNKLGYIFSASYKNSTVFYDDLQFGEWQRPVPEDEFDLVYATRQNGIQGRKNVLLGGLAGISYKTITSKYKFNIMHLQNGESSASQFEIDNSDDAPGQSGYFALSDNLEYGQRSITNALLSGDHFLAGGDWEINWKLSPTFSSITDPDIRKTPFTYTGTTPSFEPGQGGNPSRIWRFLDEINAVAKVDFTRKQQIMDRDAKLKFGAMHVYKNRSYDILRYDLVDGGNRIPLTGDPNDVMIDENLYPVGPFFFQPFRERGVPNPNEYQSNVQYSSLYISEELYVTPRLKTILGLRGELFRQRHTGRDQIGAVTPEQGNVLNNDLVLDDFNLFPSANLIFSITEDQNLRGSYYRSIARPSFKELSFATILDPVSNRTFNGGLFEYDDWDGNLVSTLINNFDIGWELYMNPGELISVNVFYKQFADPIEIVRIPVAPNGNDFQPRNVGDGQLFGLEFQVVKSLNFLSEGLKNFNFSGNLTLIQSQIDMTDAEFNARKGAEKVGQTIENTRPMAGQAPYIINAGFSYDNNESGISAGLFYNVKGRTLEIVGGQSFPDVYAEQFHSLNFTLNKSLGEENRATINFKVTNILNDRRESFYRAFEATPQIFTGFSPGVTFSVGFRYNLI